MSEEVKPAVPETPVKKPIVAKVVEPPKRRFVVFEITPDGLKLTQNDCVSPLEYIGVIEVARNIRFDKK